MRDRSEEIYLPFAVVFFASTGAKQSYHDAMNLLISMHSEMPRRQNGLLYIEERMDSWSANTGRYYAKKGQRVISLYYIRCQS